MNFREKPTRTCINCRGKFNQSNLLRLQCKEKQLSLFSGVGRSFYLCQECCSLDVNRLIKSIYRECKNKAEYQQQLKEMIEIWMIK